MMNALVVRVANTENWNKLLTKQKGAKSVPLADFLIWKPYQRHTLRTAPFARRAHLVNGMINKEERKNRTVKIAMLGSTLLSLQEVPKVTA
jgi:hypothetical protein